MSDEVISPRPGSSADLSRRMDRMEQRQDDQAREIAGLAGAVARVEDNQKHAEKLNELRFNALDTAVKNLEQTLGRFMDRINAIVSGEVRLPQNEALIRDYRDWRAEVDADREEQAVLNGQVRLLGRLAILLVSSNVVSWGAVIYAVINSAT